MDAGHGHLARPSAKPAAVAPRITQTIPGVSVHSARWIVTPTVSTRPHSTASVAHP